MKSLAAAVLAVMGATTVARANVEVGGIAGFHIFREDDKLGQGKDPMVPAYQSNSLQLMMSCMCLTPLALGSSGVYS